MPRCCLLFSVRTLNARVRYITSCFGSPHSTHSFALLSQLSPWIYIFPDIFDYSCVLTIFSASHSREKRESSCLEPKDSSAVKVIERTSPVFNANGKVAFGLMKHAEYQHAHHHISVFKIRRDQVSRKHTWEWILGKYRPGRSRLGRHTCLLVFWADS